MQAWLSVHQEVLVLCSEKRSGHLQHPGQLLPRDCSGFGGTPCRTDWFTNEFDWATGYLQTTNKPVQGIHVHSCCVKLPRKHRKTTVVTLIIPVPVSFLWVQSSPALHSNAKSQSSGDPPSHGSTMCKAPSTILRASKASPCRVTGGVHRKIINQETPHHEHQASLPHPSEQVLRGELGLKTLTNFRRTLTNSLRLSLCVHVCSNGM